MNPSLASDLTSVMIETMTGSGIIYCPPVNTFDRGTDTVIELDRNILPERGGYMMWISCAAALDGCIYFMQSYARRVMKLDPNNGDAIFSVRDDLGGGICKYIGTVVGIDGCVYGIPDETKRTNASSNMIQ